MSRAMRLPPELESFLARPGPLSLVIRGPPGSGKSTLGLAALEAFYGRKVFVTGRKSRQNVLEDYPWLGQVEGREIEVIDSVVPDAELGPSPSSHDGDPLLEESETGREVRSRLPPAPPELPPSLRAAWERTAGGVRSSPDISWLPSGIRRALALIASEVRALIVVDSWDAFVDEFLDLAPRSVVGKLGRPELERALLRVVAAGHGHLILVLERNEPAQLDYLVDGIVTTERTEFEERLERWVHLPKLRGVRIENATYPFTLEGTRFECITPSPTHFLPGGPLAEPDDAPTEESLWPGASSFASVFGRLPVGELTLLEMDREVPDASFLTLVYPMVADTLRRGARVILEPPPGILLLRLWNAFASTFTPAQFHDQVRIISPGASLPPDHPLQPCLLSVPTGGPVGPGLSLRTQVPKLREFVVDTPAGTTPSLSVFSADALRAVGQVSGAPYTAETLPAMVKSYLVGVPVHLVFLARTGDPLLEGVRLLASIHLRLRNRRGRTFLYGIRPPTAGFVLIRGGPDDPRPYDLLRLV